MNYFGLSWIQYTMSKFLDSSGFGSTTEPFLKETVTSMS